MTIVAIVSVSKLDIILFFDMISLLCTYFLILYRYENSLFLLLTSHGKSSVPLDMNSQLMSSNQTNLLEPSKRSPVLSAIME